MSSNWRSPSVDHLKSHQLKDISALKRTEQEEFLETEGYDRAEDYRRFAADLKNKAARAKLAAKDAEFKSNIPKKNKRKRAKKASSTSGEGGDHEEDEESVVSESSEELGDDDRRERNQAEIERLRKEVEAAKQEAADTKKQDEDALRAQHLGENEETAGGDGGPMIKKKRRNDYNTDEPSSLIANLTAVATPPHDFSKKLGLSVTKGEVLFPTAGGDLEWQPPESTSHPNVGAFQVDLNGFDKHNTEASNNTVAIKFSAPSKSSRFSINIAAPDHNNFDSVLFHFNPRQYEKNGRLVLNNKENENWGQGLTVPLSELPLIFGPKSVTLLIQINQQGYDIYLENQHCARLEHRQEIPEDVDHLVLQFPSSDDSLKPEEWKVFKVWWGNHPSLVSKDDAELAEVPGVNSFDATHPRKLFISKLSWISTATEVDYRKSQLYRVFRPYESGQHGPTVTVRPRSSIALVEFTDERAADLALAQMGQGHPVLTEMGPNYRLTRAKRSRHEALEEERAATAPAGSVGAGGVWD